jgi:hypothetical protein
VITPVVLIDLGPEVADSLLDFRRHSHS